MQIQNKKERKNIEVHF